MDALIERFDPNHENRIPVDNLHCVVRLWLADTITVSQGKTLLGLNQAEGDELDALLASSPGDLSNLTGLLAPTAPLAKNPKQEWSDWVRAVLLAYENAFSGFSTASEVRGKLGLEAP